MRRVVELIRVSTKEQAGDDRASIPAQRTINRRTCQAYGLEIVRSIEITDVSGASVLLAPEIQQLIRQIASPEIHGVVTREFTRLMRPENFADYALLQAFADSKTVLYLPEGPIDLTNKTGRLMGTIRAAIAGMERTEILERVWAAKEEKRRRGELAQSEIVLPFGVGYDKGRGWFYKSEAAKVRKAFREMLAGNHNYVRLADMVGVTPRGMHLILRNPIWMGWRVIDKKRDSSAAARIVGKDGRQGDRRKMLRAPDEIIRVQVIEQPLIRETEWRRVQRIMDAKQKLHWRARPEEHQHFTYNGFLVCGTCDDLVYSVTSRAQRRYYVCKRRRDGQGQCDAAWMRRETLESKIDELLGIRMTDSVFRRGLLRRLDEPSIDGRTRNPEVECEVLKLRDKRQRILDAYFDGTIEAADRDNRLAAVDGELAKRNALLGDGRTQGRLPDTEQLAALFEPFAGWKRLGIGEKRRLLAITPLQVKVADCHVSGLYLSLPDARRYEDTHTDRDSSPPPA